MQSEEQFSVTEKDRKEIDEALSKYETDIVGLPLWQKMDAPEYLVMTIESLRKKTPEELSEAIFQLNQYGLNIQRTINRNRAWERWAKLKIDQVAVSNLDKIQPQYERMTVARHGPELCQKLQNFLVKVSMRLDRLNEMPNHIKALSDSIRDIKFAALRREKEFNKEN